MAINIIERAVTPYNASEGKLVKKEQYALYAPTADINKPGMAGYDPKYFAVRNQIVQLSKAFLSSISQYVEMDGTIDPDGIKDANNLYLNFVHDVIDRRSVNGVTQTMVVTGTLFVFRADDTITELLFADGRIWSRKIIVTDEIISDITEFEPTYDHHVTSNDLATNSVDSVNLKNGSVTSMKLAAKSVTTDKLSTGAVTTEKIADNAVTTEKVADGAIIFSKLSAALQEQLTHLDDEAFVQVEYDTANRRLTFTSTNGLKRNVELPLEFITDGSYSEEDGVLTFVLINGQTIEIPLDEAIRDAIELSASGLPPVTDEDNGKILRVVDGAWAIEALPTYLGEYEVL